MKIWVIGRSYPQEINNMQGSFELEQAKMLAKYGNDVSYVACVFHPFKKVKKWGFCHWTEDHIRVFSNSQFYAHERMKLHLARFQSSVWREFLKKVERETGTPDVIHVHYPANITVAKDILAYKEKGVKIVCSEHWSQVLTKSIDSHESQQLKEYVEGADAFICVSPPLKKAVQDITGTKQTIHTIPNIINDCFQPSDEKKDGFHFIAVGVLFPNKQFDGIIRAFAATFRDNKEVGLTVVGSGIEERRLKELACALGVESQIVFTGRLSRENTAREVGSSHVLVSYSRLETFCVPIIEAWACGLPVIATTSCPVVEQWDDLLGIQISPSDEEQLGQQMKNMYEHYSWYQSDYIIRFARDNYSEQVIYNSLMNIYNGEKSVEGRP